MGNTLGNVTDQSGDQGQQTPTPNDAAAKTPTGRQDAGQPGEQSSQESGDDKQFTPPSSQDEMDRIVEARLARERAKFAGYDDLKAKAERLDKLEDAKKTDEQRAAERIAQLEKENSVLTLSSAKARIAAEKGLDPDLLAGSTEDELTEHAEKLAAAIKAAAPTTTAPRLPGEGSGQGSTQSTDWLRDALTSR